MSAQSSLRPYLIRLLVVFAICLAFTIAFNEISFLFQKDNYDRAPKTIQLVIPAGTAKRVEAGESVPSIPEEMVFVLGDVLEVKNEDNVSHQLGPVWVPPGATSRLTMEIASKLAYSCSFAPTRYLGLDVRQPTTLGTRLTALAIAAPTLTVLVFLYSLLIIPVRPSGKAAPDQPASGKI